MSIQSISEVKALFKRHGVDTVLRPVSGLLGAGHGSGVIRKDISRSPSRVGVSRSAKDSLAIEPVHIVRLTSKKSKKDLDEKISQGLQIRRRQES